MSPPLMSQKVNVDSPWPTSGYYVFWILKSTED